MLIFRSALFLAVLAFPVAAHAGCDDYDSQGEAQRALTLGAYELDTNGTGLACEGFFDKPAAPSRPASRASTLTCEDFPDQASAQRAYQTGARQLDSNRNGRACDAPGVVFPERKTPPSMTATCADFTTREQAQAAFLQGLDQLDRDKNGLACEHLPSLEDFDASDDIDKLGAPSFLWQKNDLGVQPRASRPFTEWPSD